MARLEEAELSGDEDAAEVSDETEETESRATPAHN
jgi:hypothetical protein